MNEPKCPNCGRPTAFLPRPPWASLFDVDAAEYCTSCDDELEKKYEQEHLLQLVIVEEKHRAQR